MDFFLHTFPGLLWASEFRVKLMTGLMLMQLISNIVCMPEIPRFQSSRYTFLSAYWTSSCNGLRLRMC